jgi:hypothetical protein
MIGRASGGTVNIWAGSTPWGATGEQLPSLLSLPSHCLRVNMACGGGAADCALVRPAERDIVSEQHQVGGEGVERA